MQSLQGDRHFSQRKPSLRNFPSIHSEHTLGSRAHLAQDFSHGIHAFCVEFLKESEGHSSTHEFLKLKVKIGHSLIQPKFLKKRGEAHDVQFSGFSKHVKHGVRHFLQIL